MRVLVRIQVARSKPGIDDLANLPGELIVDSNPAKRDRLDQARDGGRITGSANQNQVNSNVQLRRVDSQVDRVLESGPTCHQRSRRKYSAAARMHDTFVYIPREAEIVGIDD